ncbi:MAG TPA: general stress protein [Gemmataceae bacterium]|nr:general stress protein [Gemmataceae bacterium]
MSPAARPPVVGVFHDQAEAGRAVEALHAAGFLPQQIGVVVRAPDHAGNVTVKADVRAEEGAATGALAGVVIGGVLGAAVAVSVPGIGPALAVGLIAGLLGGGTLGIAAGGLIGALIGLGLSEEEAHYYEREVHAGRTLVTVRSDGRGSEAAAVLRSHGAYDIESAAVGARG